MTSSKISRRVCCLDWARISSKSKSCNRELETQAGENLFVMTTPRVISLLVVFQPFNDDNASLSVGQSLRLSGQQTMGLRSTATINSFLSFRGLSQSVSRNCSLLFQGKQHARASKYKVTQLRNQFRKFRVLVGCYRIATYCPTSQI